MPRKVEFDLDARLTKYDQALKRAIRTAEQFDREMSNIQRSAKAVGDQLKKISGKPIDIDVDVDTGKLDSAESKIKAIDGATPSVDVTVDETKIDAAETKIKNLSRSKRVNVVKGNTSAIDTVAGELRSLKALATIDLAINAAGYMAQIRTLPLIGAAQDQQQAERILQVVNAPAEAAAIVNDIYAQAYGASREEVARVVGMFSQAGVPLDGLEDAALSAYDLTTYGYDINEIFRAQQSIVSGGLASSYREAADLLGAALTGPAGAKDDVLDTFYEYSSIMSEIGLTGEQFVGLLNSGVEAGAFNTDKIADGIKEANVRIQEAVAAFATGDTTSYGDALLRVDQLDEAGMFVNGQTSAAKFFEGLIAGISAEGTAFDFAEIFGSPAEDLGPAVLQGFDFGGIETEWLGTSSRMATIMNSTVGTAWGSLVRTFENQLLQAVDQGGAGLQGWVDGARKKIETLGAEIRAGTAIPEALEIALEAPGLADRIRDLEAGLGNFIIEFLTGMANIVNTFNPEAAAGMYAEVTRLALPQLEYELKFADSAEEVEAVIRTGLRRGLESDDISTAVSTVTGELIEEGTLIAAEQVIARVQEAATNIPAPGQDLSILGGRVNLADSSYAELFLEQGGLEPLTVNVKEARAALDEAKIPAETFADVVANLLGPDPEGIIGHLVTANALIPDLGTEASGVQDDIRGFTDEVEDLNEQLPGLRDGLETDAVTGIQKLRDGLAENTPAITSYWTDITNSIKEAITVAREAAELGIGGSGRPTGERAAGGPVMTGGRYLVGERGPEMFVPSLNGVIIPNHMLGGGQSTVNVYVNQSVYTGSAGAIAATDRLTRQMAGYL